MKVTNICGYKGPFQKHVLLVLAVLTPLPPSPLPFVPLRASRPDPSPLPLSFVPLRASRPDPSLPPSEARAFGTVPYVQ